MNVNFVVSKRRRPDLPSGDLFDSQEEENQPQIRRLPSRRRSRTNFSEAQCDLLERTFSHTHYPDHQMKREIAFRLGIASDRVTVCSLYLLP
uniref:Homeobox domain-containing protein n=1 Tax=Globodera pallida TaxID=36090 RepID=A0A183CD03_GLOPA